MMALRSDRAVIERWIAPAPRDEYAALIGRLAASLKSKQTDDVTAEMQIADTIEALERTLPAALVELARQRCMDTMTFVPTAAEITATVRTEINKLQDASHEVMRLLAKAGEE